MSVYLFFLVYVFYNEERDGLFIVFFWGGGGLIIPDVYESK
jgi:hypothetical protein